MRRRVSMKINIIKSLCIYDVYKKKKIIKCKRRRCSISILLSISLALSTIIIKIVISLLSNMNIQVGSLRKIYCWEAFMYD